MRGGGLLRLLGLAGVALFFVTAFTPLAPLLDRWAGVSSELEPSDAIVVLAHGISRDGTLTNISMFRAGHGISLYRKGLAPLLVLLGSANEGGPTEADVRAELAREQGVPREAILTDAEARTTHEEVRRVTSLLRPRGVRKILLVSNSLHIVRARPLFERAGFLVYAAPTDSFDDPGTPEGRLALMRDVVGGLLAWVYYRLAGTV